jgi:hypothetical protein
MPLGVAQAKRGNPSLGLQALWLAWQFSADKEKMLSGIEKKIAEEQDEALKTFYATGRSWLVENKKPDFSGTPRAAAEKPKTSAAPVQVKKVEASSVYPADGSMYYPTHVSDSNPDTAWFPRRTSMSAGEWIKVYFDGKHILSSMKITNGWVKNDRLWRLNSRIKNARLIFSDGSSFPISLADTQTPATLSLDNVATEWVQLVIEDIHPGKVSEAGISEMSFNGRAVDRN